jgi:hypothetical protein
MARAVSKAKSKTKAKTGKKAKKTKKTAALAAAAPVVRCVDFGPPPVDNTVILSGTNRAGFIFTATGRMMVNRTAAEQGLQFSARGMRVTLPAVAHTVTMRVGAWNGSFTVQAYDSRGVGVRLITVSRLNVFHNRRMAAARGIKELVFAGGGEEGILVKLCGTT